MRPRPRGSARALAWLLPAALATLGCAGDDAGTSGSPDGGAAGAHGEDAGPDGGGDAGGNAFVPDAPLQAPDRMWTWVEFPNTQCRDGSPSGLGLSLDSSSRGLMIFLQGGGACFDSLTCLGNPHNDRDQREPLTGGLFDRARADNPVRDWNHVFVPYCTGDVHAGTNAEGSVDGVAGTQRFVGRLNLEKFLQRIVPTFPDVEHVLLAGVSAGGFGATANAAFVQETFGDVPVTLIDDSGPPMSSAYVPSCLQARWRTTWGLDGSLLADCGGDCPDRDDFLIDYMLHLARAFPERTGGLIETTADSVITAFYGYGTGDCTGNILTPMPADEFEAGLLDFRMRMQDDSPGFGTYYLAGSEHTWLASGALYTQTAGGVRLIDWVRNLLRGRGATHVGP